MGAEATDGSARTGDNRDITIEVAEDHHAHDIKVRAADLDAGDEVTYTSTVAYEHSHTVTLTAQIIGEINAGQARVVASNPDATGHSHAWLIEEPK